MTLGFSLRMAGTRHLPRRGPFLIVANHQSFFDPIAIGVACSSRRMHWLARRTLFKPAWFAWMLTSYHVHPIDQEGMARGGLMTMIKVLEDGHPMVIFPEGTRSEDGNMSPLKPGLLLVLRKQPVPVVPVGITGAFEAMPYWKKVPRFSPLFLPATDAAVAVSIGKPLDGLAIAEMPREEALATMAKAIEECVEAAKKIKRKV
jgi:1-acyl-sn-glycerol-3-phosphate acyltransferase